MGNLGQCLMVELVILLPRLISLFPKICFSDEVRGIHKDFLYVSLGLKLPLEDVKNASRNLSLPVPHLLLTWPESVFESDVSKERADDASK